MQTIPGRFNSLRLKLVAVNLAVVLVSLWGFTLFSLSSLRATLEASQMDHQLASVKYMAVDLDQKLRARQDGLVSAAAHLDTSRLADAGYLQSYLEERYPFQRELFAGTQIVGKEGRNLADFPVVPGRRGANYSDRDYFEQAVATRRAFIGKPFVSRPSGNAVVAVSAPVIDAGGAVVAVVMGAVDLNAANFLGTVTDTRRLGSTELYLLSIKDALVVASSDKARVMTPIRRAGETEVMARLRAGFEGATISRGLNRVEKVYSVARVPAADWLMVQAVPTEVVFAPVRSLARKLLIGSAAASLAALLAAAWLARRVLGPLARTSLRLDAMSTGAQLLCQLPQEGESEVRLLIGSFNRLAQELVSHRQRLEELVEDRTAELAAKERFLKGLIDALPGMVSYWTTDLRCGFSNREQLEWFGRSIDEVRGLHAADALGEALFRRTEAPMRSALQGEACVLEQEWVKADGHATFVLAHYVPDIAGDQVQGMFAIATDVTVLKLTEHALIDARTKADAANVAKSDFLANMSHELRTPLNSIIGFAQLLHNGAVPTGSAQHALFLGYVVSSGRHLLQLINDLLDLSKIEAGKLEFFPEPFAFLPLVDEAVDALQELIAKKSIAVTVDISPEVSRLVMDPVRLRQVLYNFLSNAIKFTLHGGNVTVRGLPEGRFDLRLEVEDDGIGIDALGLSRLFVDFQQLDSGYSKQHQGTGLGLALTRRLVEAQGGSVGARSTPGQGSVFHALFARVRGLQ